MMDMPTPAPPLSITDASRSAPPRSAGGAAEPAAPSRAREADPRAGAPRQSVQSVSQAAVSQAAVSQAAVSQATREIADYMQSVSRSLKISVDDDLGTTVIRVVDPQTDKLIRQIPPEEALALARFIAEQRAAPERGAAIPGILFDAKG